MMFPRRRRTQRRPPACQTTLGRSGFTLAELLVACVIMAIALLGVHTLFRHIVTSEGKASLAWNDRRAAQAVVDHLADTLQNAVNVDDVPGIISKPGGEVPCVICRTPLAVRRYTWQPSESKKEFVLQLQKMTFSGSGNLAYPEASPQYDTEEAWSKIPFQVVAVRLGELSVQAQPVEAKGADSEKSGGSPRNMRVSIHVVVGRQACERTFITSAAGSVLQ